MSRRHPTLEELDAKRQHIAKDLERLRPVLTFEGIIRARKYRHDFNPCARPECALRNTTPEALVDLMFARQVDVSKLKA